jgi:hypothetical protein
MLRGFHLRRNFNICQEPKAAGRRSAAENVAAIETRRGIFSDGLSIVVRRSLHEGPLSGKGPNFAKVAFCCGFKGSTQHFNLFGKMECLS